MKKLFSKNFSVTTLIATVLLLSMSAVVAAPTANSTSKSDPSSTTSTRSKTTASAPIAVNAKSNANSIAKPAAIASDLTEREKAVTEKRDAKVTVKTNTKPIEVIGEVVDSWCFTSGVMGEGRGESHRKCGRLCVGGGVTAGILADDGTLYIAAKHQGYTGCAGLLLPYVADRVKVKGWLAERGGLKLLKINSVERVKSGSTSAKPAKAK